MASLTVLSVDAIIETEKKNGFFQKQVGEFYHENAPFEKDWFEKFWYNDDWRQKIQKFVNKRNQTENKNLNKIR